MVDKEKKLYNRLLYSIFYSLNLFLSSLFLQIDLLLKPTIFLLLNLFINVSMINILQIIFYQLIICSIEVQKGIAIDLQFCEITEFFEEIVNSFDSCQTFGTMMLITPKKSIIITQLNIFTLTIVSIIINPYFSSRFRSIEFV